MYSVQSGSQEGKEHHHRASMAMHPCHAIPHTSSPLPVATLQGGHVAPPPGGQQGVHHTCSHQVAQHLVKNLLWARSISWVNCYSQHATQQSCVTAVTKPCLVVTQQHVHVVAEQNHCVVAIKTTQHRAPSPTIVYWLAAEQTGSSLNTTGANTTQHTPDLLRFPQACCCSASLCPASQTLSCHRYTLCVAVSSMPKVATCLVAVPQACCCASSLCSASRMLSCQRYTLRVAVSNMPKVAMKVKGTRRVMYQAGIPRLRRV